MNNTQLAVLLRNYLDQFARAIEDLKDDLPDSMREEYENILNQKVVYYPALKRLHRIRENMEQDIETLQAAPDE